MGNLNSTSKPYGQFRLRGSLMGSLIIWFLGVVSLLLVIGAATAVAVRYQWGATGRYVAWIVAQQTEFSNVAHPEHLMERSVLESRFIILPLASLVGGIIVGVLSKKRCPLLAVLVALPIVIIYYFPFTNMHELLPGTIALMGAVAGGELGAVARRRASRRK